MTLQEALTLAVFSTLIGFMLGCWLSTPLTRFVMRRNRFLEDENAMLKAECRGEDNADWWKKR